MKKNETEFVFVSLITSFFVSEKNTNLYIALHASLETVTNIPVFLCIIRLADNGLVDRPQYKDTESQCLAYTIIFITMTDKYVSFFLLFQAVKGVW